MRCCKNCGWLRWVTTTDTSYYCEFVGRKVLGDLSDCCQVWKPIIQTNADRIRSMTDEELVKHLSCQWKECKNLDVDCDKCLFEWLKEEVIDDTGIQT